MNYLHAIQAFKKKQTTYFTPDTSTRIKKKPNKLQLPKNSRLFLKNFGLKKIININKQKNVTPE